MKITMLMTTHKQLKNKNIPLYIQKFNLFCNEVHPRNGKNCEIIYNKTKLCRIGQNNNPQKQNLRRKGKTRSK